LGGFALIAAANSWACTSDDTPAPAEVEAGVFDAGSPDTAAHPDTSTPDTSTPDTNASDTGVDSPAPKLTLTASNATVNANGDVTLTAATSGGATATSVSFSETLGDGGTTALGNDSTSPFEQVVSYTFAENGTHTYVAKADIGGGNFLTSDPITVTVNISPNGSFVDPVNGNDSTNDGSQGSPFKTIQKAKTALTSGQTLYLRAGTYDATSQSVFEFTFANPTFVRGYGGVATIAPTSATTAFIFSQGGGVQDVVLKHYQQGIQAQAGTFTASNVLFDGMTGGGAPFSMVGSVNATIDESMLTHPVINSPNAGFASILVADAGSTVSFKGGTFDTDMGYAPVVFARGHTTLTVDGMTIQSQKSHAILQYDNAHITLKNVVITDSGLGTSSGLDRSCIAMGGLNTETPMTTSLVLENTTITTARGYGIALSLYNVASTQTISLTNSHVDSSVLGGIRAEAGGGLHAGQTVTLDLTNSTVSSNGSNGISLPRATMTVSGGAISSNAGNGIELIDLPSVNSLKIRGTTFDANTGDAIMVAGAATSVLDLGKNGDDGGLTFTNTNGAKSAVHLTAVIAGSAIGNTWTPNAQGADNAGHYVAAKTLTSSDGVGRNGNIVASASLVVK
jgi:hypothetical protein